MALLYPIADGDGLSRIDADGDSVVVVADYLQAAAVIVTDGG